MKELLGIEQVWCLTLPKRADRRAHASKEFEAEGIPFTYYFGVDRSEEKRHGEKFTGGMVGCFESHKDMLDMAVNTGIECLMVTEDDLLFVPGYKNLLQMAVKELPKDWDMIYLGYESHKPGPNVNSFGRGVKMLEGNKWWGVPHSIWGTHGYVVRGRHTMEKLLEGMAKMEMQVDQQWIHLVLPKSGLKYYACHPMLIKQVSPRVLSSDVQNH